MTTSPTCEVTSKFKVTRPLQVAVQVTTCRGHVILLLILTAFLVRPLQEGHGWWPHYGLHRLYCVAMSLTVSLIHRFKVKCKELKRTLRIGASQFDDSERVG